MPIYHRLGPGAPHGVREAAGRPVLIELFGSGGFGGISALLYHTSQPTMVKEVVGAPDLTPKAAEKNSKVRLPKGFAVPPQDGCLASRVPVLANGDVHIALDTPRQSLAAYFYENTDANERLFVHRGTGKLCTQLGSIAFEPGDYLLVPRGVVGQIAFDGANNRLLITESFYPTHTLKRYRNYCGQLPEYAPYSARGYKLKTKKQGARHELVYPTHPCDVVGWDSYNYPFGTNIRAFQPLTGQLLQLPPVQQHFETKAFVGCSFAPRLFDYHPQVIPAPCHHSRSMTFL